MSTEPSPAPGSAASEARILPWYRACFGAGAAPGSAELIKDRAGRLVWSCGGTDGRQLVLIVYRPAAADQVNASLPAQETARKCALAMRELAALGCPAPRMLAEASGGGLSGDEVAATVAAYAESMPVDGGQLAWFTERWSELWSRRSGGR